MKFDRQGWKVVIGVGLLAAIYIGLLIANGGPSEPFYRPR